ncbi:MAG: hypothetical protein ACRDQG_14475, partial [Pseudonocardiaceae bacterium]
MAEPVPYQPDKILGVLERHAVRYVVIGGLAAEIHGSPYITRDVDVTPARDRQNFDKLAAALRELEAKLRVVDLDEPLEIALDERSFDQGTTWTFVTRHGNLDIALLPDGTRGFDDLKRGATRERLSDDLEVDVASLADA